MKCKMLLVICVFCIVGCGYVGLKSRIAPQILNSYENSAIRVNEVIPKFVVGWGIASGMIQESVDYEHEVTFDIRAIMKKLDSLHEKAVAGTLTDRDKGAIVTNLVDLEIKAGDRLNQKYGLIDLARSFLGF